MYNNKQAFTLIELVVVVLIIGILAAIALPQYKAAVLKARYTQLQNTVLALAREAELYYTANGSYPDGSAWSFVDAFNIDIPGCSPSARRLNCNNFKVDIREHNHLNMFAYEPNFQYGFAKWFANSNYPNRRECAACETNPSANSMCKSLGGTFSRTIQYDDNCKMNAYILP